MKKNAYFLFFLFCALPAMSQSPHITNPDNIDGVWYNLGIGAYGYEACVTYYDNDWANNYKYGEKIIIPSYVTHDGYIGDDYVRDIKYHVTSISSRAFMGCSQITSISLPSSIRSIAYAAFGSCSGLQTITLPDSVTDIYDLALSYCTGLQSLACRSLTPPTLHATDVFEGLDMSIPLFVRVGCVKKYKSASQWGKFTTILPMTDSGSCNDNVDWSWDFDTKTLTISGTDTMPNYAKSADVPWSDCLSYIEKVVISDGVTSIGNYAFTDCPNLTSVTIGTQVVSIGSYAFYNCSQLPSMTIPDNVEEIEEYAFGHCEGVKKFYVGKQVKRISSQAFYSTIADTIVWNARALEKDFSYSTSPLRGGWTKIIIFGDDVEKIPNYLFYNNEKLESVSFGKHITTIGEYTFNGSEHPNTIYWNVIKLDSAEYSLHRAFYRHNIERVIFGDAVDVIPQHLCANTEIKTITIPNNITVIGESAFAWCDSLRKVTLGSGVKAIENYAFVQDSMLTNITIPDNVKTIGKYAFQGCYKLANLSIGKGVEFIGDYAFEEDTMLISITIPDNVKTIGKYAFGQCKHLENISIGKGVDTIGGNAFYGSIISRIIVPDNVKVIGEYAFASDSLRYAYVGKGVDSIGQIFGAYPHYSSALMDTIYWNAKEVTRIEYADMYGIGKYYFPECRHVIFGPDVEVIPNCFRNNTLLREIIIPDNVKRVSAGTFYGCDSVSYIYVGKNVKYVGEDAFAFDYNSCKKHLVWNAENYSDEANRLEDIIGDGGLLERRDLFDTITLGPDIKRISRYLLIGMSNIKHVNIPINVKTIAEGAFSGCNSLISLFVPESVDSIGNYAFNSLPNIEYYGNATDSNNDNWGARSRNGFTDGYFIFEDKEHAKLLACSNAASGDVIIPQSVKSIQRGAFNGLDKIISITIPGSIKIIPYGTFASMQNLKSVNLEEGIEEIEQHAFYYDQALSYISLPKSLQQIAGQAFEGTPLVAEDRWQNGLLYINDWLIASDNTISGNIIIPDNTRGLAETALGGKSSVTSITLPQSVVRIGERAFVGCSSLKSMTLPDSVTMIRYGTFLECTSLEEIKMSPYTTSIGEEAFKDCQSLTTVKIPNNLKEIGWRAFEGCSNINAVYIDDLRAWCDIKMTYSNPLEYSGNLYLNDTLITHLSVPEGVRFLQSERFINNKHIVSVVIPSTLDSIEHLVFYGCTNITSVTWNAINCRINNEDYTNNGPFQSYDNKISNFTFGENVESIPADLCLNLGLDTIRIPKNVRNIGRRAFKECYANAVICEAITPPTMMYENDEEAPFYYSYCDLYVPAESVKTYKNSKGWSNFYNIYPIGLEKTMVDSTAVDVIGDSVIISWAAVSGGRRYEITIFEDTISVYYLVFDSDGNLLDYAHKMPGIKHQGAATASTDGWKYTITDLKPATSYLYQVNCYNYSGGIVASYEGYFITSMFTYVDTPIEENQTGIQTQKVLLDNVLYIKRNEALYDVKGRKIK